MKLSNTLEEVFSSKVKIAIIKHLCSHPEKKFTGREIARLVNVSSSRASEVLELFRKNGVANRIKIGNAFAWTINQESILVEEISGLINLNERIYEDMKSEILEAFNKEERVVKIILYRSVSKRKRKKDSQINIYIIVKNKKDKEIAGKMVHKINNYLLPRYGNVIYELIYSEREWKLKGNDKMIKKIESEGEVILDRREVKKIKKEKDVEKDREKIGWDKVAEHYGLSGLKRLFEDKES